MTPPETKVLTMTGRDLIARFCTLNLDRTGDEAMVMLRDEIVAALRQTRGEPSDEELTRWREQTGPSISIAAMRALLQRFGGGSGISETEVRERERKAWLNGAVWGARNAFAVTGEANAQCDREYPAPPAAPKGVTLSDGSVVTRDPIFTIWTRKWSNRGEWREVTDWRQVLNQPTDTGADFDAVKALAAQVRQEGR